jgi:phosphate starvation-inducible PhoH-like protein
LCRKYGQFLIIGGTKLPRTKRREKDLVVNERTGGYRQTRSKYIQEINDQDNLIQIKPYLKKNREVVIVPRNLSQENYLEFLNDPTKFIVFAIGPAGTGKTLFGVQMAIKQYKEGVIDKIVITRPAVCADEDLGFLPGTLNEKMQPWVIPIMDVFKEYYHPREVTRMLDDGIIEIAPLSHMRGRTFKNSFIIADECQNTTKNQLKMLLTRLGEGSKMVVTGDLNQADRPHENGLLEFCNLFAQGGDQRMIAMAEFDVRDVERHPVVKEILRLYKEV